MLQLPKQRCHLAQLPTPIHPWPVPGVPPGCELHIKRDDLTGMQLSGNKVGPCWVFLLLPGWCQSSPTSYSPCSSVMPHRAPGSVLVLGSCRRHSTPRLLPLVVRHLVLAALQVRKLEFLMAEAVQRGHDSIITIGGIQSNHARATAVAARYLGLPCHLILRNSKHLADSGEGPAGAAALGGPRVL